MTEEKQKTIIEQKDSLYEATKEEFLNILKMLSPGTSLRTAIDNILDARMGGLIILENESTEQIMDGGFKINTRFTPQKLLELAKMDGAIVLSKDGKRISRANVILTPDSRIETQETGSRHKAAERTAKMTGTLGIAISERRNQIHIYFKDLKYNLRRKSEILRNANETLQILEKQRDLFDLNVERLDYLEISSDFDITQTIRVIQKGKTMQKILESKEKILIELGNEAVELKFRIREIMKGVAKEIDLVIKDYTKLSLKRSQNLLNHLTYEELTDLENILLALARNEADTIDFIKGYRLLSRTCLNEEEKEAILKELKDLNNILNAKSEDFEKILGKEKSIVFSKELEKIKER